MRKVAWSVFITVAVGFSAGVIYAIFLVCSTPDVIHEVLYDDYRRQALEMIRAEAGNFFNLSTALLAGLWAAIILPKESRVSLQDTPNLLLFILANVCLGGSLLLSLRYTRLLSRLYWDMGPLLSESHQFADVINSPWVQLHYQLSSTSFFASVVISGCCVFSNYYFGDHR